MIFNKYVTKEFFRYFFVIIIFFLIVYVSVDFLEKNTRYFPKYNALPGVIAEFYLAQLPKITVDLMPFAAMFSSIIVFWLMARSGEVTAMRAVGLSVLRMGQPIVWIGLGLSIGSFLLAETLVPKSLRHLQRVETEKIEGQILDRMFLDSTWVKGSDSVLRFKSIDGVTGSLKEPEYYAWNNFERLSLIVTAQQAVFDSTKDLWVLQEATITRFAPQGNPSLPTVDKMATFETNINAAPPQVLREDVPSDRISFFMLSRLLKNAKQAGGVLADREVDLHQKLSMPFANLFLALLGLPFSLRKERQTDNYIPILVSLGLAFAFWIGNASLRNMAQAGILPPVFAGWSMAIFLGLSVGAMLWTLNKGT